MTIIEKLREKAQEKLKRIVLPEGEEERVIRAAAILKNNNFVIPIILGNHEKILNLSKKIDINIKDIEFIDPAKSDKISLWSDQYYELRKHKGMTPDEAHIVVKNPLYFAALMLKYGLADGAVAGSVNTTGDVLRAAIQIVGLADNVSVVSSSFIMSMPNGENLTFADCAVIPEPDAEQLASIAVSSAGTHEKLVGEKAIVAMLSFSTKGSAQHPSIDKVLDALNLVNKKVPHLKIDGELQFDAAYLETVGAKKAPGSEVAGKANTFIFPNLDSGNIGYKMVQRLAGAKAIGPVIQGLKKPYNDLSRGCSIDDIVNVACICSILSE